MRRAFLNPRLRKNDEKIILIKMKASLLAIFLLCIFSKTLFADEPKNLVVTTFDGKDFDLKKLRGKIVVVNFWAYWCENCARAMVEIDELHKECPDIDIIGLSIDRRTSLKEILARADKLSYANALLANASVNNFPEIEMIPTTYIVNENGVAKKINGVPKCSQLK
jgi:thiol-disulfide isomerase/thioredoxin